MKILFRQDDDPPIPMPPGEEPPPPVKEPPDKPVLEPDAPVREPGPREPRRMECVAKKTRTLFLLNLRANIVDANSPKPQILLSSA